jgi:hypothetical protein
VLCLQYTVVIVGLDFVVDWNEKAELKMFETRPNEARKLCSHLDE